MTKNLKRLFLATMGTLVSLPALAQASIDRPDYSHMGWGWGHTIYGPIMMILVWGSIIFLVVLAFRWLGAGSFQPPGPQQSHRWALGILQERFARGEIDKDEFEERKDLLSD
jgi:putative membrane protein